MDRSSPECAPIQISNSSQNTQNEQNGIGYATRAIVLFQGPLCAGGDFIIRHKDVIGGLSTLAVAIFTFILALATVRLWNSTKGLHEETARLAELAEKQAAALVVSEAAVAWVNNITLLLPADAARRPVHGQFYFSVRNSGRSNAFVTQYCVCFVTAKTRPKLPSRPVYDARPVEANHIVPPAHSSEDATPILRCISERRFTARERDELDSRTRSVVAFGYIEFTDSFKKAWRSGFAYELTMFAGYANNARQVVGPPAYWEINEQQRG